MVVGPQETVEDVVCYMCRVRVEGTVTSDVVSLWGSVEIEGSVASDVVVIGGAARLGPRAIVGTDVVTIGGPVETAPGAQVHGETAGRKTGYVHLPGQREVFLPEALTFLLTILMVGLVGHLVLASNHRLAVAAACRRRWLVSVVLALGFCGLLYFLIGIEGSLALTLLIYLVLALPEASAIASSLQRRWLLTTIIGLGLMTLLTLLFSLAEYAGSWEDPFEETLLYLFLGLLFLGLATAGMGLGGILGLRRSAGAALGSSVLGLLMLIPVAGSAVLVLAVCVGVGAMALSFFQAHPPAAEQT